MAFKLLALLPIIVGLVLFATMAVSYAIGMAREDSVLSAIPYPSDLGVHQPEKGIFSVGICVSAALNLVVVFIRFYQVNDFYPTPCYCANGISLSVGLLTIIGQCLVPAFSLKENYIVHYVGAAMFFGGSSIYIMTQAYISRKYPFNHCKWIYKLRLACSILCILMMIAYALGRTLAPVEEHRYRIPHIAEWLLAIVIVVFTFSFTWDFQRINVKVNSYELLPRSPLNNNRRQNTIYTPETIM